MFFGIQVKSNQKQADSMVIANPLRITQAVLDPSKSNKKDTVSLVAEYEGKQFILCVIDPTKSWQCPLDLAFLGGSNVKFFIRGTGVIHLTGYEDLDDDDDMSFSMSEDESVDEPVKANPIKVTKKTNGLKSPSKLKAVSNGKAKENEVESSDDEDISITDDDAEDEDVDDEDVSDGDLLNDDDDDESIPDFPDDSDSDDDMEDMEDEDEDTDE